MPCPGSVKWFDIGILYNIDAHSTIMHRSLSYWICFFFALCLPLQKAGLFARDPSRMSQWAVQLLMRDGTAYWNLLCLFGGGEGVPAQKFGLFVTAGGRIYGRSCGWISCPYSTSLCPYFQETKEQQSDMFRFGPQPTPCTIVVLGMFSGQRSTQQKGPSGEPC